MADDASSSSSEEERIPFSKRAEFSDVVPVPQDDGPVPVCPINYEPEFTEVMGYFRALLLKDERSARALEVTTAVIELSAANYTAWHYRRAVLDALHPTPPPPAPAPSTSSTTSATTTSTTSSTTTSTRESSSAAWLEERAFVTEVAREHPKNYQVWYHRRCLVDRLRACELPSSARDESLLSEELEAAAEVLRVDGKNYHAWTHRQWALTTFKAWARELAFVDAELAKDVRNNSAWNERWTTLVHVHGSASTWSEALRISELQYAQTAIARAPNNESAWSFARALARSCPHAAVTLAFERWCLTQRSAWPTCAPLLASLVDLGEEALRSSAGHSDKVEVEVESRVTRALEACQTLLEGIDDVHAKFWRRRKHRLAQLHLKLKAQ